MDKLTEDMQNELTISSSSVMNSSYSVNCLSCAWDSDMYSAEEVAAAANIMVIAKIDFILDGVK